jgi:pimeloyl-ACP methyl ester carboxylesterase
VFGVSEGGNSSLLFAATYPERTAALMTFGSFAKRVWSPEYPWAPTPEARAQEYALVEREWGNLMDLSRYIPSRIHDADYVRQAATYFRRSVSPRAAVAVLRMNTQIDASSVLPAIRVPTLVMHRTDDRDIVIDKGRWLAARIQGAKFVGLLGDDHWPWIGDCDSVLDEVQEFVTGVAAPA